MTTIDNLTIGEVKGLVAAFGGLTQAPTPSILAPLTGKHVVVRSTESGVWMGILEAVEGRDVRLSNARRIWHWVGAASCSGLATHGPGPGSKIPAPVSTTVVLACSEVCVATAAAVTRLDAVPAWVA